jgi:hypothetical protein
MKVAPVHGNNDLERRSEDQAAAYARHAPLVLDLQDRVARHFPRREPRERVMSYLTGLLSDVPRKNSQNLAAYAQESRSDGMHRLLTTAKWDAEAVRDELRSCVAEWFGDHAALLVVGQASFVKRGRQSAGVHEQYNEVTERKENCQVGLFLEYTSTLGTAFIDRELYIPREWQSDPRRCARAGISSLAFASRQELAIRMLRRALADDIPASWVVIPGLTDIGAPVHEWLQHGHVPNVVEIPATAPLRVKTPARTSWISGQELVRTVPVRQWQLLDTGSGRWMRLPIAVGQAEGTACSLLMRYDKRGSSPVAVYAAYGPVSASLRDLVQIIHAGEAAGDALCRAKSLAGLDHYQARRYEAWYRHVTLALMADAVAEVYRMPAERSTYNCRHDMLSARHGRAGRPAGTGHPASRRQPAGLRGQAFGSERSGDARGSLQDSTIAIPPVRSLPTRRLAGNPA